MENRCVICDEIIPEGIQFCIECWKEIMGDDTDEDNESGKPCI